MELDKRIKDKTGIQTCISFDKKYIGKKGFFFDEFCQLIDLKAKCCYGTLIDINETDVANDLCFKATSDKTGYNCFFRFFIPEDSLLPEEKPEKKYRPYSLNEFLERYKIGDTVTFRLKKGEHVPEEECRVEYTRLITGYETLPENRDIPGKSFILLGGCPPTSLARLFEFYELENEYYFPTVWQPFGTEVEEKE